MRFKFGPVPLSSDFEPENGWAPIREPSPQMMQFYALPIGLATGLLFGYLWLRTTPLDDPGLFFNLWYFLLFFVPIIVVHEFIHAVGYPMAGRSNETVVGCWPSKGVFYAHYLGELTRNRMLTVFLLPIGVMSVLPLLAAMIFRLEVEWLAFVSTWNAVLACGDLLGSGLIVTQVPSAAIVRNQGWFTYWRRRRMSARQSS